MNEPTAEQCHAKITELKQEIASHETLLEKLTAAKAKPKKRKRELAR